MAAVPLTTEDESPSTHRFFVAAVAMLGLATGFVSWLLRNTDAWWSSTLGNVAVAVLLLVPGEFALRWVRSGFRRVEHAAEQVRVTAESAQNTAERAERSLDEVRQALLDRQVAEHSAELDIYRNMVGNTSRQSLVAGLKKATDEGVITAVGVRSPVWETDLHFRYVLEDDGQGIRIQLETDDGSVVSVHPWNAATAPEDFYQHLVQAVRDAGRDLGVMLNDPTQSVEALSEMLVEACWRSGSGGHRPAGRFCGAVRLRSLNATVPVSFVMPSDVPATITGCASAWLR